MPMTEKRFEILDKQHYLLVRCGDNVALSLDLLFKTIDEEIRVDRGRRLSDIWDLRGAVASDELSFAGIKSFIEHIRNARQGNWHSKTALLIAEEYHYGFARMFSTLAEDMPVEYGIFEDMDQALEWLRS